MTKSVEIPVSEDDLEILNNGSPSQKGKKVESIFDEISHRDMEKLLSDFCQGERETFECYECVTDVFFESDNGISVSVSFTGDAYFGCRDMDRREEYEEVIVVTIDADNKKLILTSSPPDPVIRDPDYY